MLVGILLSYSCCDKLTTNLVSSDNTYLPYRSGGQKSEISFSGLKSGCAQGGVLSGDPRGEIVFFTFPASGDLPLS